MTTRYYIGILLVCLAAHQAQADAEQEGNGVNQEITTGSPPAEATEAQRTQVAEEEDYDNESEADKGYVFGYRNGYIHAALGLGGEWTDNLYNDDSYKKENFLTQISPSVWLTLPRRSKKPIHLVSDNTAIGGFQYSPPDTDVYTKLQAYLAGTIDFKTYTEDSDLNHADGDFEAMLQYRPREKITFQLLDKYNHSRDIFNIAEATKENNRVYDSNVFGAGAVWYSKDKFSVKAAYRNFFLEYDEAINDWMNRSDNGFDCALYYEYSEKTNFFLQYQYLFAEYDKKKMPDNDNNFLAVGINWLATVKTNLMAKVGYQKVDYDEVGPDSRFDEKVFDDSDSTFYFESQGIWRPTAKNQLLLNAKYSIEQSDTDQALNKSVFAARFAFGHRFTDRLRGDVNLVYEDSDYAQFNGDIRNDNRWYFRPEIQFAVKKWLFLNGYYSYDGKDSNYDRLDYATNTLGIGLRGSF